MRARAHLQGNPPSAHHPQGRSPGSRELITSQDISIPHHQDVPSGAPRQSASGPAAADVLHSRRAARHRAMCSEPRAGPPQVSRTLSTGLQPALAPRRPRFKPPLAHRLPCLRQCSLSVQWDNIHITTLSALSHMCEVVTETQGNGICDKRTLSLLPADSLQRRES